MSRIIGTVRSSKRAGILGHGDAFLGKVADLLRGGLAALGELAHLAGDDGESLAVRPGTGRLDGSVQGQQVGLVGDVVHDQDLLSDLPHGRDRLTNGLASLLGLAAGIVGDPGCIRGVLGITPHRGSRPIAGCRRFPAAWPPARSSPAQVGGHWS